MPKHVRDLLPGATSSFGLQHVAVLWLDVVHSKPPGTATVSGGSSLAARRKCVGLPRCAWSKKFARSNHHDILEKSW